MNAEDLRTRANQAREKNSHNTFEQSAVWNKVVTEADSGEYSVSFNYWEITNFEVSKLEGKGCKVFIYDFQGRTLPTVTSEASTIKVCW